MTKFYLYYVNTKYIFCSQKCISFTLESNLGNSSKVQAALAHKQLKDVQRDVTVDVVQNKVWNSFLQDHLLGDIIFIILYIFINGIICFDITLNLVFRIHLKLFIKGAQRAKSQNPKQSLKNTFDHL